MNTEAEGESDMEQKKRRESETGQLVREGSGQEEHDAVKDATLKDVRRRFSSLGWVGWGHPCKFTNITFGKS